MAVAFAIQSVFVLLLLFASYYGLLLFAFAIGLQRVMGGRYRRAPATNPRVSVIVAARNEAESITACIERILGNDYPVDRFDLTIVDDASTDQTAAIVRQLQARYNTHRERLRLLQVADEDARLRAHKKHAIQQAIGEANGEIILLTDADCEVPSTWISAMVSAFTPETGLVSGPVLYHAGTSAFSRMQALEFMGLVAIGAGAIGIKRPNLCNGANVGYRRVVFLQVNGYEGIDHVTSGDDEMLMQKIAAETDWGIRYCVLRSAAVLTDPSPDLGAFANQRRRWASKGTRYQSARLVAMIIGIYAFFVLLFLFGPASLFIRELRYAMGLALSIKVVAELALLVPAALHFRRPLLLAWFVPAQLVHIPYIVILPAAGLLAGYRWKDRDIAR